MSSKKLSNSRKNRNNSKKIRKQSIRVKSKSFKRILGVTELAFIWIVKLITNTLNERPKKKSGRPSVLSIEDKVTLFLKYTHQYNTYEQLAHDFKIGLTTVFDAISLVKELFFESKLFFIKNNVGHLYPEHLIDPNADIFIDVTESKINRPKKNQAKFYSGKKKAHTIKTQVTNLKNKLILTVSQQPGSVHDYQILKETKTEVIKDSQRAVVDMGYTGLKSLHENCLIPKRKPRGKELTPEEKRLNAEISSYRIASEHTICHLKYSKILSTKVRSRKFADLTLVSIMGIIANLNNHLDLYSGLYSSI